MRAADFESAETGSLLLYDVRKNGINERVALVSNGFFDLNGVPPWDLWVGLFKFSLAAWIPDTLIEVAELGMANADRYVFWDTWRDFLLHQYDSELPDADA